MGLDALNKKVYLGKRLKFFTQTTSRDSDEPAVSTGPSLLGELFLSAQ